jgi:hypothetical protein
LASLYAVERQDLANLSNVQFAIVGAGLAYLLAAIFGMSQAAPQNNAGALWLAVPLPIVSLIAFHALLLKLSIARTKSCDLLEQRLVRRASIKPETFGTMTSNRIMDIGQASIIYWPAIIIAYAGVYTVLIGLIVWAILNANQAGISLAWQWIVSLVYLGLAMGPGLVYLSIFRRE